MLDQDVGACDAISRLRRVALHFEVGLDIDEGTVESICLSISFFFPSLTLFRLATHPFLMLVKRDTGPSPKAKMLWKLVVGGGRSPSSAGGPSGSVVATA